MPKLLMLKGLPGSGKSTYARELIDNKTNSIKRVNKDDLRAMIDNGKHSKGNESLVLKARDSLIRLWLSEGKDVIVDDTNFASYHETALRAIAAEFGARFEVKLIDTPLEVCIERDSKRPNPVGANVIRGMYNKYLSPVKPESRTKYLQQDKSLPRALAFDIDGCVTLINPDNPRSPYDMTRVSEDIPNDPVCDILLSHMSDFEDGTSCYDKIVFVSGRNECARGDTIDWLYRHNLWNHRCELFMRPDGDNRKDYIVKEEIYRNHILGRLYLVAVYDDRRQVVDHIRGMGLPVFQVAPGEF